MSGSWIVRGFSIVLVILIVLAGFGNAVLYLWNSVLPAVFGLRVITYWQAVGLLCLSWIFFGSWRWLPGSPSRTHATLDQRLLRLTAAEEKAARSAASNG